MNLSVFRFYGGVMFPLFFVIMNFALQLDQPYWIALAIAGFGMYFPHMYCSGHKKKRPRLGHGGTAFLRGFTGP